MAHGGMDRRAAIRSIGFRELDGYPVKQVNNQQICGPHPRHNDYIPPKGSEVIIKNLPRDVVLDDLMAIFPLAGAIFKLRLMVNYKGNNRGYAFITYLDNFGAGQAVKLLDNYTMHPGRSIRVLKSIDNCKLYLGGISRNLTKNEILRECMKHTDGVKDIILYSEYEDKSINRGFVFIEYVNHGAAAIALKKFSKMNVLAAKKKDWAKPEPMVDPLVMRKVKILFCRNLPAELSKNTLLNLFSHGGKRSIVKIYRMRDWAFVHFAYKSEASVALDEVNGLSINGNVIEVLWARPPNRSVQHSERIHVSSHHFGFNNNN